MKKKLIFAGRQSIIFLLIIIISDISVLFAQIRREGGGRAGRSAPAQRNNAGRNRNNLSGSTRNTNPGNRNNVSGNTHNNGNRTNTNNGNRNSNNNTNVHNKTNNVNSGNTVNVNVNNSHNTVVRNNNTVVRRNNVAYTRPPYSYGGAAIIAITHIIITLIIHMPGGLFTIHGAFLLQHLLPQLLLLV